MSQETDALVSLLKSGQRPAAVIFMDGFNLRPNFDGSEFSSRLSSLFREMQSKPINASGNHFLDLIKIKSKSLENEGFESSLINDPISEGYENDSILIEYYINRLIINSRVRQALAKEFNFQLIQVLQPNVFFGYPKEYLPKYIEANFSPNDFERVKKIYNKVYMGVLSKDYSCIDMKDLYHQFDYPVFVDACHYSPSFNHAISSEIAKHLKAIPPNSQTGPGVNATGSAYVKW